MIFKCSFTTMPTKKSTSPKTKKKKTVKSTKKTTKKKTTKKASAKKSASKKKTTKRTTARTKKTTKPKAKKKSVKKSVPVNVVSESKEQLHIFPEKRTLINQLPVIDLDELHITSMKVDEQGETIEKVSVHSRLAFYLGVFMGAVVVNAFLVTILAVMSV